MAFDFGNVLNQAEQALQGGNGGGYTYNLVYPNVGTLTVKLLFNPKSNSVMRLINRHQIGDDKIACLRTYNQDCPICKAINDINNARGIDLSKLASKPRGIALAQYVESSYKVDNVKPGDTVLLMFPWTVYKDINSCLSQAKTQEELEQLIAANESFTFTITRGTDNKYTTQISPFKKWTTCGSQEEFVNYLNGLESLNDQVLKDPISPEDLKDVQEVAMELNNKYLTTQAPQWQNNPGDQVAMNMGGLAQQFQQQSQQSTPEFNRGGVPQQTQIPNNVPQYTTPTQQTQVPTQQTQVPNQINPGVQIPNNTPQMTTPQTASQTPPQSTVPQSTTPIMNPPTDGTPNCFGQHGSVDPNRCLMCPQEIQCTQASPV